MSDKHRYCYHITNGVHRTAISCGTATASSMEEAATIAAKRSGLTVRHGLNVFDEEACLGWFNKKGEKRNVYILHDPSTP